MSERLYESVSCSDLTVSPWPYPGSCLQISTSRFVHARQPPPYYPTFDKKLQRRYLFSLFQPPSFKQSPIGLNTIKMDFSQFNPAEQAHMTKVIERKQVSRRQSKSINCNSLIKFSTCLPDARFHETLLRPRGTLFHIML